MRYSELIRELEYWKRISEEEDPEIVIVDGDNSYEIAIIDPSEGIEEVRAIGLMI